MTFVAPRLPEPCLRRSIPLDLPAMYAAGIDPRRYEATRHAAKVTHHRAALRRITMRSGLPVNPQYARKPLWR